MNQIKKVRVVDCLLFGDILYPITEEVEEDEEEGVADNEIKGSN